MRLLQSTTKGICYLVIAALMFSLITGFGSNMINAAEPEPEGAVEHNGDFETSEVGSETNENIKENEGVQPQYPDISYQDLTGKEGIVFSENFEEYDNGSLPDGWVYNRLDLKVAETMNAEGLPTKALAVITADTDSAAKVTMDIPATSGIITFTVKVKASQTNANGSFGLNDSKGKPLFQIDLKNNGATNIFLGYPLDLGVKYTEDQWYEFKVVMDTYTNMFDTYIDGTKRSSRVYFRNAVTDAAQFFISQPEKGTFFYDDIQIEAQPVNVTGVTLFQQVLDLSTGDSSQLVANVEPSNTPEREVLWASSNPEIALVNEQGVVTAVKPGTSTITVTTKEGAYKAEANVIVKERVNTAGVSLVDKAASIIVDESKTLIANITPDNSSNKNVVWESSDSEVAVVDENGKVTGVKAGTARILVKTLDGQFTDTSEVTVLPRPIQAAFYVSLQGSDDNSGTVKEEPFLTLAKAQEAVRNINSNMNGDIVVYLMGGTHTLNETFELDQRDSGSNGFNVIYTAYPGTKPMISGGKSITDWTLHDSDKNIFKASVGDLRTRQLYVNGERAIRARSEIGLPDATNDSIGHTTTMTEMANWRNIRDIEFVYEQSWTQPRNLVESIQVTDNKASIVMQQPGWEYNRNKGSTSTRNPAWIENAYELLDEPGEWYLDRSEGTLYYIPLPDQDMTSAQVIAPVTEQLLTIEGTLDEPARNIKVSGLTFAYASFLFPSLTKEEGGFGGYPDIQSNLLRLCKAGMELAVCPQVVNPAHVIIKKAEHITFERNTFTKLGQAGLDVMAGSKNISIIGNQFYDLSGSGIQVGEVDWADGSYIFDGGPNHSNQPYNTEHTNPDDKRKIIENISILNNFITNVGVEYTASVGIYTGFTQNVLISQNQVGYVPYSGITVGWGWGRQEPNITREAKIINNYVHNVMDLRNDGGGIYTLGTQPDSVIQGNYITGPGRSFANIYLDEWTQGYTVSDNVLETKGEGRDTWLLLNKGSFNNIIKDNYTDAKTFRNNVSTAYIHFSYENNTQITDGQWPQAALDIMKNAGVQEKYQDITELKAIYMSALESMLIDAEALLEEAEVGEEVGQYPQAAVDALENAIESAHGMLEKTDATQEDVDNEYLALEAALEVFKSFISRGKPSWKDGKLKALKVTQTKVMLNWSGASDDAGVTGYRIYKDGDALAEVGGSMDSYEASGLNAGTTYTFKVEARNAAGKWSEDGPSLIIRTESSGGSPGWGWQDDLPGGNKEGEDDHQKPEKDKETELENAPSNDLVLTDVSKHWAEEAIKEAVKLGIVTGYEDGTFRPNALVSRGEFTVMLSRALKLDGEVENPLTFADLNQIPIWARPYVSQAVRAGIINGYDDNTFRSAASLNRIEMTVMIARALGFQLDPNAKLSFVDAEQVPAWAIPYVASAHKAGLVKGKGNGLFDPRANATRAEAVTLILAMLKYQ